MLQCISEKQVRAQVAEATDKLTLQQSFIAENTSPGATVYTDGVSVYMGLPFDHEAIKHSVKEFVRRQVHTNGMESFWSMLKRGSIGVYHRMSSMHLNRYIIKFEGRHNVRESGAIDQIGGTTAGMVGKRLTYADLIKPNGLPSGARG